MDIFDLFAKLTLDSSDYEKNLGSAQKETGSFASKLKTGLATAGKVGAAALGAVTAAAGLMTKSILDGTKEVASYGDNIDKASQKMGISAEAYQEWDAVLQHSGTSIDALGRGMITLSKQAQKGGDAFKKLGLSEKEVANMSQEDLFSAVIAGLQDMEEGTERTALAAKLLGGSAKELGPLLNTSAEDTEAMRKRVRELGGVMSNDAVKAAAKYQDSLQDMQTALNGAKRGITAEFLPAVTSVMDGLTELFAGNGDSGIAKISEGIGSLADKIGEAAPKILELGASVLTSLAQSIAENAPQLISSISGLLPDLIPAVTDLLFALVDALLENLDPIIDAGITLMLQLGNGLIKAAPKLAKAAIKIITQLAKSLSKNVKPMIEAGKEAIKELVAIFSEQDTISDLIQAGIELLLALADGLVEAIPSLVEQIPVIIESILSAITDNMPMIFEAATTIITSLIEGLVENLPQIIDAAIEILLQLVDALTQNIELLVDAAIAIITAIADGLVEAIPTLIEKAPEIIGKLVDALIEAAPKLWDAATELIDAIVEGIEKVLDKIWDQGEVLINELWDGIKACWEDVKSWGKEVIDKVVEGFDEAWDTIVSIGTNIVNGLWQGISDSADWLWQKVSGWVSDLVDGVLDFLGIASPSKVFAEIGDYTAQGFGVGFGKQFKKVSDDVRKKMSGLTDQTIDLTSNFTANLPESVFAGSAYKENARKNDDNMQAVLNVLNEIKDKNMTIVLSDGTIAGRVDRLLGQTALRKVRGNA